MARRTTAVTFGAFDASLLIRIEVLQIAEDRELMLEFANFHA
jgi:hypothetical protein